MWPIEVRIYFCPAHPLDPPLKMKNGCLADAFKGFSSEILKIQIISTFSQILDFIAFFL
jgi:hypothetical protein